MFILSFKDRYFTCSSTKEKAPVLDHTFFSETVLKFYLNKNKTCSKTPTFHMFILFSFLQECFENMLKLCYHETECCLFCQRKWAHCLLRHSKIGKITLTWTREQFLSWIYYTFWYKFHLQVVFCSLFQMVLWWNSNTLHL